MSRKPSWTRRVRDAVRRVADRVLAADLGWSIALVVLASLLLSGQWWGEPYERLEVGDVASRNIVARTRVVVIDLEETDRRRQEAREGVPDIYTYDPDRARRLTEELASLFEIGRNALDEAARGGVDDPIARSRQALEGRMDETAVRMLATRRFSVDLERSLVTSVQKVMARRIVPNRAILLREPSILLIELPGDEERRVFDYAGMIDVDEARVSVRREAQSIPALNRETREALADLAASFVDANVVFDAPRTRERREAVASAIAPVVGEQILRGTVIAEEGEKITPEIFAKLEAARRASPARLRMGPTEFVGQLVVVSLLAFFLYRYAAYHQRHFRKVMHVHALLVMVILFMLLLSQAILWLARGVMDTLVFPLNQVDAYGYLAPLGAGAILVALLANGRIAMVYSSFAAILFGGLNGWDFYKAVWALLVQWAAVYAISTYRERAALLRAGLVVGAAGAATALAVEVLRGTPDPLRNGLYPAAVAFVGGAVGVGLVVSFALPLFETLFNVLTDIRLLELSNVNNPLLSQLAVLAPGSYNHSQVVGTLAEEAAKAIGANSLLCRVAAFYHDIGKIRKPEYYVENMRGSNPHDRLAPSMSALIIAAHVKDGIQVAREAGLPQQIIDIIPQHHGTRLMSFFYEKARKLSDPSLGPVKEQDFRYPGPKPQTKEAAVFMLADAVEAAARTVEEPTANKFREVIRKITNTIVLDGQLEECDLTFSDLTKIQKALLRTLVSFHHQRVDYPGFDFKRPRGEGRPGSRESARVREIGEVKKRPPGAGPAAGGSRVGEDRGR